LPTVSLGDSSSLQLGQTVITIGNALGEFRNTVSRGVVSGLARHITASSGSGSSESIDNVIQTDAAINPGNSGGPLINLQGQVVGVNVAMVSGAQNIGFALPINVVKSTIDSVEKTGTIKVAYLGVRYVSLNADLAKQFNVSVNKGALIKGDQNNFAVEPNSPADKAGLKEGDVIEKLDGQTIDQNHSLASIIAEHNPSDQVTLTVLRDGKTITLKATLAERKNQ
jgi:serine protease Do